MIPSSNNMFTLQVLVGKWFTIGDYIRQRRLTLAGNEIVSSDEKIIDIALKYGYESPDSFTKAFTRFHGVTPTAVRKNGAMPQSLQDVNQKIYSEWLPNCKDYEIAAGYNIEMYDNPDDYPNKTQDENYYSEIWIPVKKK